MTNALDAEVKISRLIDLLKNTGGLRINGEITGGLGVSGPSTSRLCVEMSGPDVPILLHNNAELLQAIQHVAAAALRLEDSAADQLWFDAGNIKAGKKKELERLAQAGIESVRLTSRPYSFPPMMACERRLLHLALMPSGLKSASSGFGGKRCVILYPEGIEPPVEPISTRTGPRPGKRGFTAA